jgi:serine/threonine protein kinase
LKSSNILLDSSFNAKISDFGLAVSLDEHGKNNIKLSGTLGYVAPEYLLDGKLTDKSDVYAFGVVLLELLLGRRPVEKLTPAQCQSLVTWAMPQLTDRSKLPNIVDAVIKDTMDLKHLYQVWFRDRTGLSPSCLSLNLIDASLGLIRLQILCTLLNQDC